MTKQEALSLIVDALDNVEDFDEALNVLREDTNVDDTWRQKYEDLSEKYKARFKSEILEQPSKAFEKEKDETNIETDKPVKLDELDFSGETE